MQSINAGAATARATAAPTGQRALIASNAIQLFNERIKASAQGAG